MEEDERISEIRKKNLEKFHLKRKEQPVEIDSEKQKKNKNF